MAHPYKIIIGTQSPPKKLITIGELPVKKEIIEVSLPPMKVVKVQEKPPRIFVPGIKK